MQDSARCRHAALVLLAAICAISEQTNCGVIAAEAETDPPAEKFAAASSYAVSDWGPVENGLQMRVSAPREIEQGMPLNISIERRTDMDRLDPRIRQLNMFRPDLNLQLMLTDRQSDTTWELAPYDPTFGFPTPRMDTGKSAVPLDGTPIDVSEVKFPLLKLYKELHPARYECELRFTYSETPTRDWRGDEDEWKDAGFWYGTLVSGRFPVQITPETPQVATFLVPKQLRLRREMVHLRDDDESETAVPAVSFDKRDAEEIQVSVRNGHFIGTRIRCEGSETLQGGPLKANDQNDINVWYKYKGGNLKSSIMIEIFETADPPEHMWAPREDILWSKTFDLSFSEREIRDATSAATDDK